eukprot:725604-Amphidinium_carterae.1
MFTDEKAFRLAGDTSNSYNSRVWVDSNLKKGEVDPDSIVDETVHFARHVMVSCGVSWNGLLPPYFVEAGVKINTEVYVGVLRNYLLPSSEAALGQRSKPPFWCHHGLPGGFRHT